VRLLVLGATGMLGHDLMLRAGADAVGLGSADADVSDERAVEAAVAAAGPEIVLNCAAVTDVDGAEAAPEQARRVNAEGAGHVAAAAARAGAAVLYVSTD